MIFDIYSSKGPVIKADSEDLEKLEQNTQAFMVKLKQGIVRPPFVVVIVPTNEEEFIIQKKAVEVDGKVSVMSNKIRRLSDRMNVKNIKKLNHG